MRVNSRQRPMKRKHIEASLDKILEMYCVGKEPSVIARATGLTHELVSEVIEAIEEIRRGARRNRF